jgi:hypothetical protein
MGKVPSFFRSSGASSRLVVSRVHQLPASLNWSAGAAKRARYCVLPRQQQVEVVARGAQQAVVAGHRGRVEEDRQVHRPVGVVRRAASRAACRETPPAAARHSGVVSMMPPGQGG